MFEMKEANIEQIEPTYTGQIVTYSIIRLSDEEGNTILDIQELPEKKILLNNKEVKLKDFVALLKKMC